MPCESSTAENPNTIPVSKLDAAKPVFDWRQLQRWDVNLSALPAGSEIRFRPVDRTVQNYGQIAAIVAAIAVLIGLSVFSLYEHSKRRHAETATRERISELAVVSRQATAGEMSAAIAHELNQPLGSILNYTETAELILNSNAPNTIELREMLQDIRHSDLRATEIISHLRALMSKQTINSIGSISIRIAHACDEYRADPGKCRGVTLHAALSPREIEVVGDTVQLQQVFLNLIFNGIDAVSARASGAREIVISTHLRRDQFAEVSVSNSGPGIPKGRLEYIFNPFFTTKDNGMGVGLSLCETIVEAHNGSIWGGNGLAGGAVFHFSLPLANANREASA